MSNLIPAGMEWPPAEPSLHMMHAGCVAIDGPGTPLARIASAYRAMLLVAAVERRQAGIVGQTDWRDLRHSPLPSTSDGRDYLVMLCEDNIVELTSARPVIAQFGAMAAMPFAFTVEDEFGVTDVTQDVLFYMPMPTPPGPEPHQNAVNINKPPTKEA